MAVDTLSLSRQSLQTAVPSKLHVERPRDTQPGNRGWADNRNYGDSHERFVRLAFGMVIAQVPRAESNVPHRVRDHRQCRGGRGNAVMPDDVFTKDHVATTAGFVIGERGVLVIESMLNGDLASQLIGLVRQATPKPIRFLVNTSYHGDHAYGNYLFPESTVVIQHPATKRHMEESFEDDRHFMIGLMGKGKGIERVQARAADFAVPDMISIDPGGRIVEVRHFGFAQTPGDLVIWTPDAKVLWVGNMIQAPSPALPWLLEGRHRDTIATLARVRDFLPEKAIIIPGNGRPMRPADI